VKGSSLIDQMNIFASFGTVPKYLELYDPEKTFMENVKERILDKNSYLYNEVKFLLKEDLKEPVTYFTILETIAKGESKIGKIAGKLNVSTSYLTRYMQRLIDIDILEREVPVTEDKPEKSKLGRYRIKDKFVNFWFHYVFMNQSGLEIGDMDHVVEQIETSFNEKFVSFAFEEYAMELIRNDPVRYIGFVPKKIGRWWNNREEIDIVAIGEKKAAFVECKWQNQKVGHRVLLDLTRKSESVPTGPNTEKTMVIFSKSGFSDGLEKADGRFFTCL
jgi:AAA+ ATPase superfamily predicted ATPase